MNTRKQLSSHAFIMLAGFVLVSGSVAARPAFHGEDRTLRQIDPPALVTRQKFSEDRIPDTAPASSPDPSALCRFWRGSLSGRRHRSGHRIRR